MTSSVLAPPTLPLADPPALAPERPHDAAAVRALIDTAFGFGRFAKTAERLRETNQPLLDISFTARDQGRLVGCVRMWPIWIGDRAAVFLGPFAVDEAFRGRGLGAALIGEACEAAARAGHALILLVGDQSYFRPLGFSPAPEARIVMPGPVDPRRVLVRGLIPGALEGLGGVARAP